MPQLDKGSSQKWMLIIRIFNIVTALVLIGFGIAGIIYMALTQLLNGKFFLVFSPIFMILFGLMLIAAQFKIKLLLQHFGFLQSLIGRGIFNIYLASEVFFYFSCGQDSSVVAWISAIIIFVLGLIYIFLHFCGGQGYSREMKQQML